jgi:hypothetical protein
MQIEWGERGVEVRKETGLDNTRVSLEGREKNFFLTSSHRMSAKAWRIVI